MLCGLSTQLHVQCKWHVKILSSTKMMVTKKDWTMMSSGFFVSRWAVCVRAYRWAINFQLNWKRNRNLIMTLFSLTINIATPRPVEKKLSLCRGSSMCLCDPMHVWVRSVRAFVENIISSYGGLISIFSCSQPTIMQHHIALVCFIFEVSLGYP